jgi:hypothetical protein
MEPKFRNLFKSIWYYTSEILILVMDFELNLIAVKVVQKEAFCRLVAVLLRCTLHSPLFNETNRCLLEAIISNIHVITFVSCFMSLIGEGPSWLWSYDGWTYSYLYNQCLSPLMLWLRISIRARCKTSCDKVCQWIVTDQWFFPPPIKLTATI